MNTWLNNIDHNTRSSTGMSAEQLIGAVVLACACGPLMAVIFLAYNSIL